MSKLNDLVGHRFNRLIVVERNPNNSPSGNALWNCECDCGNWATYSAGKLKKHSTTISCGCHRKELLLTRSVTHGMYQSPEYSVWQGIKARCYDKSHVYYHNYGGLGITMCDEWRNSFETFYKDMGKRPSLKYTIDRKDGNLGYFKGNCRWATRIEQGNNTKRNVYYEFDGERKTLATWCRELNINYKAMHQLLKKGIPFYDAADKLIKEGNVFNQKKAK